MARVRVVCRTGDPGGRGRRRWSKTELRYIEAPPSGRMTASDHGAPIVGHTVGLTIGTYPKMNEILADMTDVEVTIVRDDGTEEPLGGGVEWLRFEAKQGSEPNRLTMCLTGAELDIVADVEPAMLVPPAAPTREDLDRMAQLYTEKIESLELELRTVRGEGAHPRNGRGTD